ncbi:MAG: Asp23/Gls24 family envelope stress response protein [Firmicutes bacterium]|nr:Asp23/Gls24 family envelope stress response protein [Bacillota bacterium]
MDEKNKAIDVEGEVVAETGSVKISEDVVATIAGLAATSVPGLAGMSGGMVSGISEVFGRKSNTKGVKVDMTGDQVTVDISIIVEYGNPIVRVATAVQDAVKSAIETMAGLKVTAVNIRVEGVTFPQMLKDKEKPAKEAKEAKETKEVKEVKEEAPAEEAAE